MANPAEITAILGRWNQGDREALEELLPAVYQKLHQLARRLMRDERGNHTLQATALVHEAYLSLSASNRAEFQDRGHFYAVAARVMRHILIDHAKKLQRQRRGGGAAKLSLEGLELADAQGTDLLALDQALELLAKQDSRKAWIIELRYFGGLSVEEIARLLEVSASTVIVSTRLARAWLYSAIYGRGAS